MIEEDISACTYENKWLRGYVGTAAKFKTRAPAGK
jgi:hypothetical protein